MKCSLHSMQLLLPFAHVAIAKKGAFWIEAQKTAAPRPVEKDPACLDR
jgi:hypothetical protein